ncbi:unnamed protein product [Lactuca virosa]|uniref:Uncharacterized protein n=1 Tax=Lactuca virosa TaxID=75947 RepID=A0AAU9LUG7_9ASTR|nr:unnamed protein product [Lactuca virosa]
MKKMLREQRNVILWTDKVKISEYGKIYWDQLLTLKVHLFSSFQLNLWVGSAPGHHLSLSPSPSYYTTHHGFHHHHHNIKHPELANENQNCIHLN